jgi:hypothetical protein
LIGDDKQAFRKKSYFVFSTVIFQISYLAINEVFLADPVIVSIVVLCTTLRLLCEPESQIPDRLEAENILYGKVHNVPDNSSP